jgi:hypothetical protein
MRVNKRDNDEINEKKTIQILKTKKEKSFKHALKR